MSQHQHTLSKPIFCAGVGVHSGRRARLAIRPAPSDTGIVFRRSDLGVQSMDIPARGDAVSDVQLGTTLSNRAGASVAVVEHLLAAFSGSGLDNALVEIDGEEVPIMDGSAAVYCALIARAGLDPQARARRRIRIVEPIEVRDGVKFARLAPCAGDALEIRARIDFDTRAIGCQEMSVRLTPGLFVRDLAFARTFGFARDVEALRALGLAQGGSLDNAIVIDGDAVVNPEGLRCGDEFIRHKILDAVGDLALAGGAIAGKYEAEQPGHALNNQLVRKLLDTPKAWIWEPASAEFRASA